MLGASRVSVWLAVRRSLPRAGAYSCRGYVMQKSLTVVIGALLVVAAASAVAAAQKVEVKGSGLYVTSSTRETALPDGRSIQEVSNQGFLVASDPRSPLHMNNQDCRGTALVDAQGAILTQSGYCTGTDSAGDMHWLSFSGGATGGGHWGLLAGTGKFDGAKGGGTFTAGVLSPDGKLHNEYEGTIELK